MVYHLGTSGWSYPGWRKRFYPPGLVQKGWLERTPPHFLFTLKANSRITHLKKIKDVKSEVRYFYNLADSLGDRLRPEPLRSSSK